MEPTKIQTTIGGRPLILETGRFARQASGSVLVTLGKTTVLGTAVVSKEPREGIDFLPLKVDFDEKFYASGKIKGSRFIKREGRPSDDAVLVARAIDRTMRPLFPKGFYHDIQVILTVFSYDGENSADIVGGIAASAALALSGAPFAGPVALCRVGKVDGEFVFNPTKQQMEVSQADLIIGSLEDKVMMLEAGAKELTEDDMFHAIQFGVEQNKEVLRVIKELESLMSKPKIVFTPTHYDQNLYAEVKNFVLQDIEYIYENIDKMEREVFLTELKKKTVEHFTSAISDETLMHDKKHEIKGFFEKALKQLIRDNILLHERRIGGRNLDQIRPLKIDVGIFPIVHGSAFFQRGETQDVTIVTLGGPGDAMLSDQMEGEATLRYLHHYNFPPFSVGDISTRRMTGNREIGHGYLAQKALMPVLPPENIFPYTIRLVSEILESNGSSSMAATCGSTLALMDAGVPIIRPVAGVAMGLMVDETSGNFKVLTDIQDLEDFGGDMDFKVTGTTEGITAIQVDMKIHGLTPEVVHQALHKAYAGRIQLIEAMTQVIPAPRADLAPTAPRIYSLQINPDMIRNVIGKGGETINKIIAETGVAIDINDDGLVSVTSSNKEGAEAALAWISSLTREIKIGEVFEAKVVRLMDFGAFVELLPGKDALCHISELANHRVQNVQEVCNVGDILAVKVMSIDPVSNKISVSHKVLLTQ